LAHRRQRLAPPEHTCLRVGPDDLSISYAAQNISTPDCNQTNIRKADYTSTVCEVEITAIRKKACVPSVRKHNTDSRSRENADLAAVWLYVDLKDVVAQALHREH
jgi:hypothetical protein